MLEVLFCRLGPQTEERGERELNTSIAYSLLLLKYYLFIIFVCMCTPVCICLKVHACHRLCMEVKGQPCWACSLLLSFSELQSRTHDVRLMRQSPVRAKPSSWSPLSDPLDGVWPAAWCLFPPRLPNSAGSPVKLLAGLNSPFLKVLPARCLITVMRRLVNTLTNSLTSVSSCDPQLFYTHPPPPDSFFGNK